MKIGIIGIGLMGGSFALDFRSKNKNSKIYGFDNDQQSLDYSCLLYTSPSPRD